MKVQYRSYIKGGEVLNGDRASNQKIFTAVLPVSEIVLQPNEPGDLIALWALVMCMRDVLRETEKYFGDFRYVDSVLAGTERREIPHESPLTELNWWEDKLPLLIDCERKLVANEYVGIAVDADYAMVAVTAVNWFVDRYRCRPPEVATGKILEEEPAVDEAGLSQQDMIKDTGLGNMIGLSESEKKAISALTEFDESNFRFLANTAGMFDGSPQPQQESVEAVAPKQVHRDDRYDTYFGYLEIRSAVSADGFRVEDRKALARFQSYVARARQHIEPLEARWLKKPDVSNTVLGQRLFAYWQVLESSFPNADAARRRLEELNAEKERVRREEEEKSRMRGGGGAAAGGDGFGQ